LKPFWIKNKRNSALFWVLFFVLNPCFLQAKGACLSDTLILDGELIRIEKREVEVNLDSLQKKSIIDVQSPPAQKVFSLSAELGGFFGSINQTTSNDSLLTLAQFLDRGKTYRIQPLGRLSAVFFLQPRAGVFLHLGAERHTYVVPTIGASSLAADSAVFRFENRDGELWQYFVYPIGIGFETDTTQVQVTNKKRSAWMVNLQLGGRFFLSKSNANDHKKPWKVYADLGMQWRWALGDLYGGLEDEQPFLVNTTGRRLAVTDPVFQSKKNYLAALVGLGCMRSITPQWHVQCSVSTSFPPFFLNDYRSYTISLTGLQVHGGITRFF
jgi:hypothetical protein